MRAVTPSELVMRSFLAVEIGPLLPVTLGVVVARRQLRRRRVLDAVDANKARGNAAGVVGVVVIGVWGAARSGGGDGGRKRQRRPRVAKLRHHGAAARAAVFGRRWRRRAVRRRGRGLASRHGRRRQRPAAPAGSVRLAGRLAVGGARHGRQAMDELALVAVIAHPFRAEVRAVRQRPALAREGARLETRRGGDVVHLVLGVRRRHLELSEVGSEVPKRVGCVRQRGRPGDDVRRVFLHVGQIRVDVGATLAARARPGALRGVVMGAQEQLLVRLR
mmetsp:Transcript_220/g.858  ORF Transcript_220/g.858 Transcript_220/m.858 type:complete len:276 (-) Transcript_220:382-1209(-)